MTTTIEMTDPREDKAATIDSLWQKLSFDRQQWLEKGDEARRYVTATSTDTTEVGNLPWKNRTTIPKLTQIRDNLQAYYMAALMPTDDWFRWEGSDKESHEKAQLIELYMGSKIRESNFAEVMEQIVSDWIMYGNAFAGVRWVHRKTTDPATGKETTAYVGPELVRVSPMDCAIDMRAPNFDSSPFIRRRYVTLSSLLEHNTVQSADKYDEAAIEKVLQLRRGDRSDWSEFYREQAYEMDGFIAYTDYFNSQYVEVIDYYGDIFVTKTGEVLRNRKISVAERAFVLSDTTNNTWSGRKPFAHQGWRVLPDNLYGQGPLDNLIGMQYRCDHLENLKADTFDQIVHPVVKIKGDDVEDFEWGPGAQVRVGIDGDVDIITPPAQVLQANSEIGFYHSMMEQMAGSPREMMGFRSPGEKTAFEVNVLQQGADRLFQNRLNRFELLVARILDLMLEMSIRNLDVEDLARTFNDDTRALQLATITRDDIIASGNLRPVGAKHFAARNKRLQEMQTLIQVMQTPSLAPHFSGSAAGHAMEEELGFEKYGIVAFGAGLQEQLQLQMMQQQLTQGMGGASGNPEEQGVVPQDGAGGEGA